LSLDRMLVRFSHTRSESLGPSFDEAQNRVTRHLRSEQWAEYMVVWRKDFVELYDDWVCQGVSCFVIVLTQKLGHSGKGMVYGT
jgi:hypothetical protein